MKKNHLAPLAIAASLMFSTGAFAQDEATPTVEIVKWLVNHLGTTFTVYDRDASIGSVGDIDVYLHQEGDVVTVQLEIIDVDWQNDPNQPFDPNNPTNTNPVFVRTWGTDIPNGYPPEPPAIPEFDPNFLPEEDGLGPNTDLGELQPRLLLNLQLDIPEFNGVSQARLRGLVDYDVRWFVQFDVSNTQQPDPNNPLGTFSLAYGSTGAFVEAIENSQLAPPNTQAFADAGADQTVALGDVGQVTVTLDASRTFDTNNIGFDPNLPDVFAKDTITFAWEWISGPVRVDPVQTSPNSATATITLNQVGSYVYRVLVDDNASSGSPTTDSVTINVVQTLPVNTGPTAVIVGPAGTIPVGAIITLDGSQSFDPQNDTLSYVWLQTNSLGGPLTPDELQLQFQPLSGLDLAITTWQAVVAGTFHFRLLVSDGEFVSATNFTVTVAANQTNGEQAVGDESSGSAGGLGLPSALMPSMCGAGLAPVALAPLMLLLIRRRR